VRLREQTAFYAESMKRVEFNVGGQTRSAAVKGQLLCRRHAVSRCAVAPLRH
jgi:hypothetical protein